MEIIDTDENAVVAVQENLENTSMEISDTDEKMLNVITCKGHIIDQKNLEAILDVLSEDAIVDLCFRIHRAAKMGYLFLDTPDKNISELYKYYKYDKSVLCFTCGELVGGTNFAKHLQRCLEKEEIRQKKIVNYAEYDDSDLDDEYPKERSNKRSKNTNKQSKQGKYLPDQSVFTYSYLQGIPIEERRAFFDQFCGAECKRNKRLCRKTLKCSQHSNEDKRDIRNVLLRDMTDQITQDSAMDVDTVD